MTNDFCVAGIDPGGTKTECAIINSQGECLGLGRGGTSNFNYAPWDVVRESIETALRLADEAAGPDRSPIVRIGSARFMLDQSELGKSFRERFRELDESIRARLGAEMRYYTEGEIAMACIDVFDRVGAACIAGTGSSCFVFSPDGRRILMGGWGPPIGDEGGGIYIAVRGLQAVGRAHEGRGPETALTSLAEECFGERVNGRFLALLGKRLAESRPRVASFAEVVGKAADAGDAVAQGILDDAANELTDLVFSSARKVFRPNEEFPIALHGSVFSSSRILSLVTGSLREFYPKARIIKSYHSPGLGAALLTLHDYQAEDQL